MALPIPSAAKIEPGKEEPAVKQEKVELEAKNKLAVLDPPSYEEMSHLYEELLRPRSYDQLTQEELRTELNKLLAAIKGLDRGMKENLELRKAKQREQLEVIMERADLMLKRMREDIEARRRELAAKARAKEEEEASSFLAAKAKKVDASPRAKRAKVEAAKVEAVKVEAKDEGHQVKAEAY